ncbi:MAG TPA: B12-binding domain-containing radical SAM protein [Treponema sp.]|nr:B12-binding domain-containing radical SAM protein [Treponema sp.]
MKVAISYPPLESDKGVPLLGQNRQFQWFNSPTYIYPMVPAYAASLLKSKGYDVVWNDAIAEEWTFDQYLAFYKEQAFDVVMLETKTPVLKMHWAIVRQLKELVPATKIVLVGDHVTSFPVETMENCPADYVLTGGNYDFLLASLCDALRDGGGVLDESRLEPGIYYRKDGKVCSTGAFLLNHDLNTLPFIDRDLTQWRLYSEKNGNYKRLPGTYTYAARDCWYHKCTFCSWTTIYPEYKVRSPEKLLDEIGMLIDTYHVKEIMDDSGAFPVGKWLHDFCNGMIERGYNKKVIMDCNMRFCALSFDEYKLMRKAGFRFVLFGLESANQETLDRLHKGEKIEEMIESCKLAKKAGLSPHVTIMFGYPWEGEDEIAHTVKVGRMLLQKGYAKTLQSTIVIPYPCTPLYKECKENGWLQTENYEDYDMRRPVMKTPVGDERLRKAVQEVYKVAFSPEFILRRLLDIRSIDDIVFLFRAAGKVFGHLLDFKK